MQRLAVGGAVTSLSMCVVIAGTLTALPFLFLLSLRTTDVKEINYNKE
jgi:hypothetical protein